MTDAHQQADAGHGQPVVREKKKKSGKKLGFSIVCNIKGKRGKHRRET